MERVWRRRASPVAWAAPGWPQSPEGIASNRLLCCLLCTDVVDSTGHACRLGDRRWARLLGEYQAVAEVAIGRFQGMAIGREGDGVCAFLPTAVGAIGCAQAIGAQMYTFGVNIRAGVHVGECERYDERIAGIAPHIANRVMTVARPGEILVTRTVKDVTAGAPVAFHGRGTYRLRGIDGRWQLYAVHS